MIQATTRTLLEHTSRLGPLTERQERALKRILRGVTRGQGLVDQLLEVGRAEASQFVYVAFDPVEAVLRVLVEAIEASDGDLASHLGQESTDVEKLAVLTQAGITLTLARDVQDLRVLQDRVKFDLIVGNLIQNALRFRRTALDVVLHRHGDNLVIMVKDDGPGIAPEYHAAVFERYRRAPAMDRLERKGHGLGLAGALILARRLGGDILLDSVPGEGATFRLVIPCRTAVD
jgi:signal transduction histidine kinase